MTDEARRALNRLVAEHVMGWDQAHTIQPYATNPTYGICSACERQGHYELGSWCGDRPCDTPPDYAGSIAAAWLVVGQLTQTTKQWFRYEQSSITRTASFAVEGAGAADCEVTADGESAPEAICRAALRAVGVAVPA